MTKSEGVAPIRIRRLTKEYPPSTQALDTVDLSMERGVFGLLGPNGAGKTTLMRILATLIPATSGEVHFGNVPITEVKRIRSRLGYLPQTIDFYPRLTALETLEYFALLSGLRPGRGELHILLERVGLAEVGTKMVGSFSGGMKRRLGIAAAIVHDPDVIIVDEPTAGLDPEGRIEVRNLLSSLGAGKCVLLSTHILSDIELICERLAILHKGRICFVGSVAELAEAVAGKVFVVKVPELQTKDVSKEFDVISITYHRGTAHLRVLASNEVPEGAEPTDPTSEDGYIYMLKRGGGKMYGHGFTDQVGVQHEVT